jgi:hypothetical protein
MHKMKPVLFGVPEIAGCGAVHTVRLWQRC